MRHAVKYLVIAALSSLVVSCGSVSSNAQRMYNEALAAWDEGEYDQAIARLQEAIADSPKYFDAHLKLGEYYEAREDCAKAGESYEQASALDPKRPEPLLAAGKMYLKNALTKDDHLKAQHKFSKVLELPELTTNQQFQANLGKGICKLKATLIKEARPYLEKASSLEPDSVDAIFYMALLHEAEMGGPNRDSIGLYEKVLAAQPDHLEALEHLGRTFEKLGYNQKAVAYYQKYLATGGKSEKIVKFLADHPSPEEKEENILICPDCGRIGKKGDTHCISCGVEMVEEARTSR